MIHKDETFDSISVNRQIHHDKYYMYLEINKQNINDNTVIACRKIFSKGDNNYENRRFILKPGVYEVIINVSVTEDIDSLILNFFKLNSNVSTQNSEINVIPLDIRTNGVFFALLNVDRESVYEIIISKLIIPSGSGQTPIIHKGNVIIKEV